MLVMPIHQTTEGETIESLQRQLADAEQNARNWHVAFQAMVDREAELKNRLAEAESPTLTFQRGGIGMEAWIQPVCACGWEGSKHYAYNDYQHSNVADQARRHYEVDHD